MWLASVSLRDITGALVPTAYWNAVNRGNASTLLDSVLRGLGDETRQRQFRMPVTFCRHRAVTEREEAGLPKWWRDAPPCDLAGPPLEVMWTKGIKESLSLQPCADPGRAPLGDDPDIYLIVPCGACPSCKARDA